MIQGIHKHIFQETILLDLDDHLDIPGDFSLLTGAERRRFKEEVLRIMVRLFDRTGRVVNPSKCLHDLLQREAKASTALGRGMALPHVRTLQARDFLVSVMRSDRGIWFGAPGDEPVHLFIGMLAPPYADRDYLRFLAALSQGVASGALDQSLRKAADATAVLGLICRL